MATAAARRRRFGRGPQQRVEPCSEALDLVSLAVERKRGGRESRNRSPVHRGAKMKIFQMLESSRTDDERFLWVFHGEDLETVQCRQAFKCQHCLGSA